MTATLGVAEFLGGLDRAVSSAFPATLWIKGEISGYRRTNRGAVFFRLVDPERPDSSVEVAARGRVMLDIDRALTAAGVGALRAGIEVRLSATAGLRRGTSVVQLSLIDVDPAFIAGRLAMDRDAILLKLTAEGLLGKNALLEIPLVPLRVGLVTSRGSAAHADFVGHLSRPGYRFRILTAEAPMQGEGAPEQIDQALARLSDEPVDVVALVRGGGSKLDLATFDSELLGRRISSMPVPVVTGIGHETDRSIADEVAAISLKTPTAVAEWIIARVAEFAGRVERARLSIREEARGAIARMEMHLDRSATNLAETKGLLIRQDDLLANLASGIEDGSRTAIRRHRDLIESYKQLVATVGLEPTLRRGFALVTRPDGSTVRSVAAVAGGDKVVVRLSDGTVPMIVEEAQ